MDLFWKDKKEEGRRIKDKEHEQEEHIDLGGANHPENAKPTLGRQVKLQLAV
jgi:hypothetical protein